MLEGYPQLPARPRGHYARLVSIVVGKGFYQLAQEVGRGTAQAMRCGYVLERALVQLHEPALSAWGLSDDRIAELRKSGAVA